jgi:hypothetical protein
MPSDLRRGAALLEEATRADPEFTLALVGLSAYYSTVAVQGHAPSTEVLPRAEDLARRALQVDPQLPEAHRAFGMRFLGATERRQGGWIAGAALVGAWSGAGKTERALDWLESSLQARDASLILLLAPWFDPLRPEPRFEAVTRAIGLHSPERAANTSASPAT